MKRVFFVLMCLALSLAMISCASTQKTDQPRPGAAVGEVVEWAGTVKAVDYTKRTVTLEARDGRTATFNAKYVKNLDQVKVGDQVRAEYFEEVAVFVRKADTPPLVTEGLSVEVAPKGKLPAGTIIDTVEISSNVLAIDYQKRTITLKDPGYNIKTFKVDDSVQRFNEIKVGDQVVLRHTEAFAIAVTRP